MVFSPFIGIALTFLAGILVAHFIRIQPPIGLTLASAFGISQFLIKRKRLFLVFFYLSFFLAGVFREGIEISHEKGNIGGLPPEGKGVLQGIVDTLPEVSKQGRREIVSFTLSAENLYWKGMLHDIQGNFKCFLFNPGRDIHYGDRLRIYGRWRRPKPATHPGEFDYSKYLERGGIFFQFESFGSRGLRVLGRDQGSFFLARIFDWRLSLKSRLDELFPFPKNELVAALLLGFQKKIPYEVRDLFVKTGTAHILAVSGLNVSALGGTIYLLGRFLGLFPKISAALSLAAVTLYVFLSGANPPVARAGVMGGCLFMGILLNKEREWLPIFSFAFFFLIALWPRWVFQTGFQLSFISVLVLLLWIPDFEERWFIKGDALDSQPVPFYVGASVQRFFLGLLISSWAATIGSLPLVLYYFKIFSPIGILANLIVVPLSNLVILIGFLLLVLSPLGQGMVSPLVFLITVLLELVEKTNSILSQLPFAYFYLPPPPLWAVFAFYFIFLGWLVNKQTRVLNRIVIPAFAGMTKVEKKGGLRKFLWIGIATTLLLMTTVPFLFPKYPELQIFNPRSNSLMALVKGAAGESFLINVGGGRKGEDARWILKPALTFQGIQKIDALCLTASYAKDTGGLEFFLKDFKCRYIFFPKGLEFSPKSLGRVRPYRLSSGDRLEGFSPSLAIDCLYAREGVENTGQTAVRVSPKNGMLLLRIEMGQRTVLVVPNATAASLKKFSGLAGLWTRRPDLILYQSEERDWSGQEEDFFQRLNPEMVVCAGKKGDPPSILASKIRFYFVHTQGFLRIRIIKDKMELEFFIRKPGSQEER